MFCSMANNTNGNVHDINGLAQGCINCIANALELLQSYTKPSIYDALAQHHFQSTVKFKLISEMILISKINNDPRSLWWTSSFFPSYLMFHATHESMFHYASQCSEVSCQLSIRPTEPRVPGDDLTIHKHQLYRLLSAELRLQCSNSVTKNHIFLSLIQSFIYSALYVHVNETSWT